MSTSKARLATVGPAVSAANKPAGTKRRDGLPAKAYANGRVAYWTGHAAGAGERIFMRLDTAEEAAAWADAYNENAASTDLGDQVVAPNLNQTFNRMFQAFIDHKRACGESEATIAQYISNWNKWAAKPLGNVHTGASKIWHFQAVLNVLGRKQASVATVAGVVRTIGAALAFGILNGYFDDEPFGSLSHRRVAVATAKKLAAKHGEARKKFPLEDCPTAGDVELFADEVELHYPGYGRRLVLLGFATGMRINELLALRWDCVDLTTGEVEVNWQLDRLKPWPAVKLPKGNKRRTTCIWHSYLDVAASLVLDALDESRRDPGWLFPRDPRSDTAWADYAGHRIGDAIKASTTWTWSFHWLRHAFASWSLAPVGDGGFALALTTVQQWLGHSRPSTTQDMYLEKLPETENAWGRTGHRPGDKPAAAPASQGQPARTITRRGRTGSRRPRSLRLGTM